MARGIRRPASNRLHGPRAPFAASALQPLQLADSEMDSELIAGAAATQAGDQTVGRQPSSGGAVRFSSRSPQKARN